MDLKECYTRLNGNYQDALGRLMNDRLIDKFIIKFLDDKTMSELEEAVKAGNIENSFRSAHTLKGVAANLSFTELAKNASALTEQLRSLTSTADEELYKKVQDSYKLTTDTIKAYIAEK